MAGSLWAAAADCRLPHLYQECLHWSLLRRRPIRQQQWQWWLADPEKVRQQTITKLVFITINEVAEWPSQQLQKRKEPGNIKLLPEIWWLLPSECVVNLAVSIVYISGGYRARTAYPAGPAVAGPMLTVLSFCQITALQPASFCSHSTFVFLCESRSQTTLT